MQDICPVRVVYELCIQGINPNNITGAIYYRNWRVNTVFFLNIEDARVFGWH